MKILKYLSGIFILFLFACQKEAIPTGQISESLWLEHKGAQMPILVEGNPNAKTLLLLLHGGPGGSAKVYNETLKNFSQPLEEKYLLAYYDQRLAGNSRGNFDGKLMTVTQMVEDLGLTVELIRNQYGADLKIFLFGHSWGGYLGNAYLSTDNFQTKIAGWIDVAGAHNIEKLVYDGLDLMETVANEQIAKGSKHEDEWQEKLDFIQEFDKKTNDRTLPLTEELSLEMNRHAHSAGAIAQNDDLLETKSERDGEAKAALFLDHNPLTSLMNNAHTAGSDIWKELLAKPLTPELKKITIPSLMIWGKYDFVVAPSLGEEMLQELGTPEEDKSLFIFEESGHSPMFNETEKFVDLVVDFIEKYKD